MKYQLPDPFDDDFLSLCSCHEHTRRDSIIRNLDGFFPNIIGDTYKKVSEASIVDKYEHSSSFVAGKFLHMQTVLVTITDESTRNWYNIPWKGANLSHE